jgi:hypothetical protein
LRRWGLERPGVLALQQLKEGRDAAMKALDALRTQLQSIAERRLRERAQFEAAAALALVQQNLRKRRPRPFFPSPDSTTQGIPIASFVPRPTAGVLPLHRRS